MRRLVVTAALAALSSACGAAHPRATAFARTAGALGLDAAAAAAALAVHGRSGEEIGFQVAGGTAAGVLPAALLDYVAYGIARPAPGTPGEAYSRAATVFGQAFLASLTLVAPALTTWGIGERYGDSGTTGRAFVGAVLGAEGGMLLSFWLADDRLPKWARIAISASLIGSMSTLGYQISTGDRR